MSTIFDNGFGYSSPHSFLEYNEGDIKFGDLVPGDTIYYHTMEYPKDGQLNIYKMEVSSGIVRAKGEAYIKVNPIPMYKGQLKKYQMTKLSFGPLYSSGTIRFGDELKNYDSNDINKSSICANNSLVIFGTNLEEVTKYAKRGIEEIINKKQKEIERLTLFVEAMKTKLK